MTEFTTSHSNVTNIQMLKHIESYGSTMSGVSATSSEVFAIQQDREAFEGAKSIADLKRLTIAFLRGETAATSYHFGPLLAESAPIVEKLVALNEAGFITTGSQPGGVETVQGQRIQKRAYVEGLLKRRYLSQFLQKIYCRLGSRCFVTPLEGDRTYEEICDLRAADLYWVNSVIGQADTGFLHVSEVSGPCQMFQTCDEIYPLLVDDYVSVFILDTRWGYSGSDIFDATVQILRELEEQGMRYNMRMMHQPQPHVATQVATHTADNERRLMVPQYTGLRRV